MVNGKKFVGSRLPGFRLKVRKDAIPRRMRKGPMSNETPESLSQH
jgi:hypothetical protein